MEVGDIRVEYLLVSDLYETLKKGEPCVHLLLLWIKYTIDRVRPCLHRIQPDSIPDWL